MTTSADSPQSPAELARRGKLLDAALLVFVRFGYRKASMDEVARAAGVSRQGLYLRFTTKEDLFRATVAHCLDNQLRAARVPLADTARPIDERLVTALDEWLGRYVDLDGANTSELIEASGALTGSLIPEHNERFEQAVADAIADSALETVYARADVSPAQLARTLHATARGFRHTAGSRTAFVEEVTTAVRVLCAPLGLMKRPTTSAATFAARRAGR
jgi:AcrR family transcriptional regulator